MRCTGRGWARSASGRAERFQCRCDRVRAGFGYGRCRRTHGSQPRCARGRRVLILHDRREPRAPLGDAVYPFAVVVEVKPIPLRDVVRRVDVLFAYSRGEVEALANQALMASHLGDRAGHVADEEHTGSRTAWPPARIPVRTNTRASYQWEMWPSRSGGVRHRSVDEQGSGRGPWASAARGELHAKSRWAPECACHGHSVTVQVTSASRESPLCSAALHVRGYSSGASSDCSPPTVLVVDDRSNMLRLMQKVLRRDARVLTAERVMEAIRLLEAERPSVVLCDPRCPTWMGSRYCVPRSS